jgi:hypothetical protein
VSRCWKSEALPVAKPAPLLPPESADPAVDCILYFVAKDPIPAPAVWAIQNAWSGDLSKPVHWLAKSEVDGAWWQVDADEAGRYREWAVALQLVDRRGPVSDGELGRFLDGVQQLAQQTAATLELPSRGETVIRAGKLDEFCAAVDIQFVLHIVEASGGVFAGTKLRGVAEAAGLVHSRATACSVRATPVARSCSPWPTWAPSASKPSRSSRWRPMV